MPTLSDKQQKFWEALKMPSVRKCYNCKWNHAHLVVKKDLGFEYDVCDLCTRWPGDENNTDDDYMDRWEWEFDSDD